MGDPPNPARADEQWDPYRVGVLAREIDSIRAYGVISGGWAWHLMSPPHRERKHLHDHRDVDMFVFPASFSTLVVDLKQRGYTRAWTRFDDPSREFIRYERHVADACPRCFVGAISGEPASCASCGGRWPISPCTNVKVILDLFVQEVEHIEIDEYRVVEPRTLLGFYGHKHGSDQCVAVQGARALVAAGLPVIGSPALIGEA